MSNKPETLAVVAVVVVVYLPGVVVVVAVEHGMMGRDVVWRGVARHSVIWCCLVWLDSVQTDRSQKQP
jgi:hypothetical protein